MQFISCICIASGLLILNKTLWEEKKPVMLQILHFVPPIAVSQRAVLPYQHTFTNPNIVCPAYLLPCPHPHSTLTKCPCTFTTGWEKRGSKYHFRFQCLYNVLWQPAAAWWGASRSVRRLDRWWIHATSLTFLKAVLGVSLSCMLMLFH